MSRAFVKEPDGSEPPEELPERAISPHRNFVTANGLKLIDAEIIRLNAETEVSAQTTRDLNYWLARRASAELAPVPINNDIVHFGHRVTIEYADGSRHSYQITGQDEADPAKGLISYISPLATALLGKTIGETIEFGNKEAEIAAIDTVAASG